MKTIRGLALCLIVMLFMPLLLHAHPNIGASPG
jgi:hypothetical protein